MKDLYENTSNDVILTAGYDQFAVAKINFNGMDPKKVWDIRDSGWIHPELQQGSHFSKTCHARNGAGTVAMVIAT